MLSAPPRPLTPLTRAVLAALSACDRVRSVTRRAAGGRPEAAASQGRGEGSRQ